MTHDPSNGKRGLLRRADWRFLLPNPKEGTFQNMVLLGGPAGLAERIVEIGLARRVSCNIPRERSADAVVILHNAQVTLRDAAGCLVPGGALYCEIDRRSSASLACTPGRIQRSLRDMGLLPTGIYAVKPHFDRCEMYLPLEVPGALRWYVASLYTGATPMGRLLETGLRTLTGLKSHRFALLAPYYAVTAIAGTAESTAPSVLGHSALPAELRRGNLRPLMLTDGGNRVALLPFTLDGTHPTVVLKVPKLACFNLKTENEQTILAEITSWLEPSMRRTIPRPLGIIRYGELSIGMESYAPRHSLLRSSGRWGPPMSQKIDDLRLAADWLCEFHHQAEVCRPPWGAAQVSQWVEEPLAAYRRRFGTTASEVRLFTEVRKRADSLVGTPLPIVWQHRDFNVWNIFRAGREITVIDWEGGRLGPALCDLLHFVTHWNEVVRNLRSDAAQLHGFRRLFFEPNRGGAISKAVYETIAQYMERLAIDPRFVPVLLVYTWVELALRRADQQQMLGEAGAIVRSGNRHFAFISVLAEHVEQLFQDTLSAQMAATTAA